MMIDMVKYTKHWLFDVIAFLSDTLAALRESHDQCKHITYVRMLYM